MSEIVLGQLASGEDVVDRHESHIREDVFPFLTQAFVQIESKGRSIFEATIDFEKVIGNTNCVSVTEKDDIVYARRKKRGGYTKFVRNRPMEPTSKLTLVLMRSRTSEAYVVITAYLGPCGGKEPWDPRATEESREFWKSHALVYDDPQLTLVPGTLTTNEAVYMNEEETNQSEDVAEEATKEDPKITYDDFKKVEMRVGVIQTAEKVENADKLIRLTVDVGEEEPRQIVSGISMYFPEPEALVGKRVPFVTNLAQRTIRGLVSDGMILAASSGDNFSLLDVDETIPAGTQLS